MSDKIKCPHCGKEYDKSFSYCPYCAEPKPKTLTAKEIKSARQANYWATVFTSFICIEFVLLVFAVIFVVAGFFIYTFSGGNSAGFPFKDFLIGLILIFTAISFVITVIRVLSKRQSLIDEQFANDETSICPECGSHNVSLGRKGYDWKHAYKSTFWGWTPGAFAAGMDSNRVTVRCKNCGNKWETNLTWEE